MIRLLIFILQHQFVYVRTDGDRKDEEKVFYHQTSGIGIGSSASSAIANFALLGPERRMLERIKGKGHNVRLYVRYVDDIFNV